MNILYILTFNGLSQPKSGGQNRFINLTRQMRKNHNIIILESSEVSHPEDKEMGTVYDYKDVTIFSRAMPISRDFNSDFIRNLVGILRNCEVDVILLSHPSGALITKLVALILGRKVPIIYDAHNVESNFTMEMFSYGDRFSRFERFLIPSYVRFLESISCRYLFDHVMTVSNNDRDSLMDLYGLNGRISIIPSGCSIQPLLSLDECNSLKREYGFNPDSKIVVFHGSYKHPANEEAFHLIKDVIAPAFEGENVLFLTGGSDVPVLESLNFKSVGFIEDLWEFLSLADIAIVPIVKGGGTKLKFMDYLNAGLPVVTTRKGVEGIDAIGDEQVLITDSVDDEFIEKIRYLVENEDEMLRLGVNARKLAEDKYDWDIIGADLNRLLKGVVEFNEN